MSETAIQKVVNQLCSNHKSKLEGRTLPEDLDCELVVTALQGVGQTHQRVLSISSKCGSVVVEQEVEEGLLDKFDGELGDLG